MTNPRLQGKTHSHATSLSIASPSIVTMTIDIVTGAIATPTRTARGGECGEEEYDNRTLKGVTIAIATGMIATPGRTARGEGGRGEEEDNNCTVTRAMIQSNGRDCNSCKDDERRSTEG
jgi:hypothetical protein